MKKAVNDSALYRVIKTVNEKLKEVVDATFEALPTATKLIKGAVIVGKGINVTNGKIDLDADLMDEADIDAMFDGTYVPSESGASLPDSSEITIENVSENDKALVIGSDKDVTVDESTPTISRMNIEGDKFVLADMKARSDISTLRNDADTLLHIRVGFDANGRFCLITKEE